MDKILVVARTEFATAVRTKAFLVSLLMLPIIYGAMILIQVFARKADVDPRPFAVIDRSGKLYPAIRQAAESYNRQRIGPDGKATESHFLPSEARQDGRSPEETILGLSEKVRARELFAFIEVPAEVVEAQSGGVVTLKYYSDRPNYSDLSHWLNAIVGSAARTERYRAAGVDPAFAARIDRPVFVESLGLSSRAAKPIRPSGGGAAGASIVAAKKIDPTRSVIVPMCLALIVYMITMTASPQLVSTVMEEKLSRISEMLLGSVSTFELMMGKLLGNVATAMLTTVLYLGGGYAAAARYGYADAITPGMIASLLLFVTLSIFLFGSLYMAVGSACSELKDAQTLMMPVMLTSILPMALLVPVITNPSSTVSVVASLLPPATPILMTLRMAMSPSPPAWQVGLAIGLMTVTTLACVWASGKIFRTGLLMHGKAPTFRELARWVLAR